MEVRKELQGLERTISAIVYHPQKPVLLSPELEVDSMVVNFSLEARANGLEQQLNENIRYEWLRAAADYWLACIFMWAALGSSVTAGLGGLAFGWSTKWTGAIALIPGAIAVIAGTMKFESKSDWHYRKLYGFNSLKSRLLYELPEVPTVADIAAISKEREVLIKLMEREWEERMGFSWSQFKPPQKVEPSGP